MLYELKDYQSDAVRDCMANLADAADFFRRKSPLRSAFALTAPTGAGKTVMAATCIENLFFGDDDLGFEGDDRAVVLWVSGDPSLNEQVRDKFIDSADRLPRSRLVPISNTFSAQRFEAQTVYFLNTQKLSSTSNLTRGHDPTGEIPFQPRPDLQIHNIWDTIRNTIEDPSLTLYVLLDEAHIGMKAATRKPGEEDRSTLILRLINGHAGVPPAPIVFGISATPERFTRAMEGASGRTILASVTVDPERVQQSGLLKDDILLDIPAEAGRFDTTLLRRGARRSRDSAEAWSRYAQDHDGVNPVLPLMVVQVPNKPSEALLAEILDTIFDEYPEMVGAVAQVFGEQKAVKAKNYEIPYISPQHVEETTRYRVLLAKDAISTGWDCPRAEVLVSFRRATDKTHITQLLGRMVRTPLARRIPGDDVLNSVACLLPNFDRDTAEEVAAALISTDESPAESGGGKGRKVVVNASEMRRNEGIDDEVFACFVELPSMSAPVRTARPIRRFTRIAHMLSEDAIRPDAVKEAHAILHRTLDGLIVTHKADIDAAIANIEVLSGETLEARTGTTTTFTEMADDRAIDNDFRAVGRLIGLDVARTWADHLAGPDNDDGSDNLREAHITVASIGLVPAVIDDLEAKAIEFTEEWLRESRVDRKNLDAERRSDYNQVAARSTEPQLQDLAEPKSRNEATSKTDTATGEETLVPTRALHLLSDDDGNFPVGTVKGWELTALDTELSRDDLVAWYRNPSRPTDDAISIPWQDGTGRWRLMQPDLVIFNEDRHGNVRASIVDPHGDFLGDALPKLRGFAEYAESHHGAFHRIEALAKVDDEMRVLDLTQAPIREAISTATDARALYTDHGDTYATVG